MCFNSTEVVEKVPNTNSLSDVCYIGPKVVSNKISVASIEEVSSVLKRPPVIWDNIHANDYDPQRIFLGPYKVKR